MKAHWLTLGLASATALAACTVTVVYDPRGTAVSLEGDWTIDGAPADATNCSAAGITDIRLVFLEGSREYRYTRADYGDGALEWACANGNFNTGTGVLDHGLYSVFWEAVLSDGRTAASDPFTVDVVSAGITHFDLGQFQITTSPPAGATLGAMWTIDGAAPDAASCTAAGLAEVRFILFDASDTSRTSGTEIASAPCADGQYMSATGILAEGSYLTRITGVDGSGAVVAMYDSPDVLVVDLSLNTHYNLMAVNFTTTPPPPTLRVNFGWDTDPSATMVDADCATAGVTTMNYMLTLQPAGSPVLDEDYDIACLDTFDWTDLAPGEYRLFVEGFVDTVKTWESMACDMYVVDSGIEEYNCFMNNTSGST
jgi:hypothetical protein